ncbi:hypothetical protein J6590_035700 [Homalodisca vitripennis]|nr:hypothetical protein J6590_035700 [Homalodisca vitripennis]
MMETADGWGGQSMVVPSQSSWLGRSLKVIYARLSATTITTNITQNEIVDNITSIESSPHQF